MTRTVGFIVLLIATSLVGFTSVRIAGTPIFDWLLLALFAGMVVATLRRRPVPVHATTWLYAAGVILLVVGATLSMLNTSSIQGSLEAIAKLGFAFALLPSVYCFYCDSPEKVRALYVALAVSALLVGGSALAEFTTGIISSNLQPRMEGVTEHSNELGTVLALTMPFLIYVVGHREFTRAIRVVAMVALFAAGTGIFLASSFTGLIAGVITSVGYLTASRNYKRPGLVAIVVLALAAPYGVHHGVPMFLEENVEFTEMKARLLGMTPGAGLANVHTLDKRAEQLSSGSIGTRVETWRLAYSDVLASPWVGKGIAFEDRFAGRYQVHNFLLMAFYCTGVIGFIGALLIYCWPLLIYSRVRQCGRVWSDSDMIWASLASVLGLLAVLLVSPSLYVRAVFFPLFALFAILGARSSEESSEKPGICREQVAAGGS